MLLFILIKKPAYSDSARFTERKKIPKFLKVQKTASCDMGLLAGRLYLKKLNILLHQYDINLNCEMH